MTFVEFREEIFNAMKDKPSQWRDGQFVFNYIDEVYGVARIAQFNRGVDCFYFDDKIEEFILCCYNILQELIEKEKASKNKE